MIELPLLHVQPRLYSSSAQLLGFLENPTANTLGSNALGCVLLPLLTSF